MWLSILISRIVGKSRLPVGIGSCELASFELSYNSFIYL
jgi:hypothetical protein